MSLGVKKKQIFSSLVILSHRTNFTCGLLQSYSSMTLDSDTTSDLVVTTKDSLFGYVEKAQHPKPFGRILDAGTGKHSLRWISGLIRQGKASSYTAITADETMRRTVYEEAKKLDIDEIGEVIIGNWFSDSDAETELCHGETYDTIVADYLVGAMDGFSPYFQDLVFPRLGRHLAPHGRLFVLGLQPIPDRIAGDANIFARVTKVRDACILLAGHRCYREYPVDWITRNLKQSGFEVVEVKTFPIMYTFETISRQLNVARGKFSHFPTKALADEMEEIIKGLETECRDAMDKSPTGTLKIGFDYVVVAEKLHQHDQTPTNGTEIGQLV